MEQKELTIIDEISYDSYIPTCVCSCEKRLYRKGNIKSIRRERGLE
jgi:hypothetical protein